MNEKVKARGAVLLGNFFFGTSVIAVKHISPVLIAPIALTAVRIGVAMILFWGMYAAKPVKMGIEKKDFLVLLLCAVTGIILNQTLSIKGMSLTSPIHASLLVLSTPIVITFLAAWFLKESLNVFKILGLLLGISGGALLILSRDLSMKAGGEQLTGDLFVIGGAICYATYVIAVRPLMAKYQARHILQWVFLFAAMFSVPFGWRSLTQVAWASFDGVSWFALAYVVLGSTFIAYQLMNYSINKLGASITGSYIYTQPFFATVAAMLLMHEELSFQKIIAAVLIMSGVFFANFKKRGRVT